MLFCPKCGTKAIEDAVFCQKCGYKLPEDTDVQKDENNTEPHELETFSYENEYQDEIIHRDNDEELVKTGDKRKKIAKYLLIVILAGIGILFIACLIKPELWYGKYDYIQQVKNWKLYDGTDICIGQVIGRYIPNAEWTERDITYKPRSAYVDVEGTVIGDNQVIKLTFFMKLDDNNVYLNIDKISIDGITRLDEYAKAFLEGLFYAYSENMEDLNNLKGKLSNLSGSEEDQNEYKELEIHGKSIYVAAQATASKFYQKNMVPSKSENVLEFISQVVNLSEIDQYKSAIAYIRFKSSDETSTDAYKVDEIIYSDDGNTYIRFYNGSWNPFDKENLKEFGAPEWIIIDTSADISLSKPTPVIQQESISSILGKEEKEYYKNILLCLAQDISELDWDEQTEARERQNIKLSNLGFEGSWPLYGVEFCLYDLDFDGKKDLIIQGGIGIRGRCSIDICSYDGNEFKWDNTSGWIEEISSQGVMRCIQDEMYYNYEDLVTETWSMTALYKLEKRGVLTELYRVETIEQERDDYNNTSTTYYIVKGDDIIEIEGKQYIDALQEYGLSGATDNSLKWYSLTEENIAKALDIPIEELIEIRKQDIVQGEFPADVAKLSNQLKKQYASLNYADGYVLIGSDYRYIEEEELYGLSPEQIRIAINEIYARHGRKFSDSKVQSYFNSKSWYHAYSEPSEFDESCLNAYEKANIDFISAYKDRGCPHKNDPPENRAYRSVVFAYDGGDTGFYVNLDYTDLHSGNLTIIGGIGGAYAIRDYTDELYYYYFEGGGAELASAYLHLGFVENDNLTGILYDIKTKTKIGMYYIDYEWDDMFECNHFWLHLKYFDTEDCLAIWDYKDRI